VWGAGVGAREAVLFINGVEMCRFSGATAAFVPSAGASGGV